MRKLLLLLSFLAIPATSAHSQTVIKPENLNLKVTKILLKKDLETLADELARNNAATVDDLLTAIDVFKRAGQRDRLTQALVRLSEAKDLPPMPERKWLYEVLHKYIHDDLPAFRVFYERIADDDGYYETNRFVSLWESRGDQQELDAWLGKRAGIGSSWFQINLERSLRLNRAQPILDSLASRVRQDPNDKNALNYYLSMVRLAQQYERQKETRAFEHETDWLGDIFKADSAITAYEFGELFAEVNPLLAIRYFQASLSKPVTERDLTSMQQKHQVWSSVGPQRAVNWEKQLRYWTKQKLAATYQRTGRSSLAQPLIEELAMLKTDDVMGENDLRLAGAVQSGSGARVIESKVLQDEASRGSSAEYWYERLRYYGGRGESDLIIQAFREALAKFPQGEKARLINWFEDNFTYWSRSEKHSEQLKAPLTKIFLDEFNQVRPDSDIASEIIVAAGDDGFKLNEFNDAVFVKRRDVLVTFFESAANLGWDERGVIVDTLTNEGLPAQLRNYYVTELEKSALRGPAERQLVLAEMFKESGDNARRPALLLSYIRRTQGKPDQFSATPDLFYAYLDSGEWQKAEKLLNEDQPLFLADWGHHLERLAIAAARNNASNDAIRIWKMAVNFVGHSAFGLNNLADTVAKPLLCEYYRQMKSREHESAISDTAMRSLMCK